MAAPKSRFIDLYGVRWPGEYTPDNAVKIERECIIRGGKWLDAEGKSCGEGLFWHYKRFQQLVWPEYDHHRWSDLILETVLKERITTVAGPKDTGKTHLMARFGLTDYLCFPDTTLILMSSTDIRGLELRVWGELKSMLVTAKERYPWLPGKAVDHLHGVFTDNLGENCDIRDMRKGIICIPMKGAGGEWKGLGNYAGIKQRRRRLLGDECFPAGAMVDMADGTTKAIERILPGDTVLSASGPNVVQATSARSATSLITIQMNDGRTLTCTPNHPLLTQAGWVKACEIGQGHFMVSPYEAMRLLREDVPAGRAQSNVPEMPGSQIQWHLQDVRKTFSDDPLVDRAKVLQSILQREMVLPPAGVSEEDFHRGASSQDSGVAGKDLRRTPRDLRSHDRQAGGYHGQLHELPDAGREGETAQASGGNRQAPRLSLFSPGRERDRADRRRKAASRLVSAGTFEFSDQNRQMEREWVSADLQSGRSLSETGIGDRGGWGNAQQSAWPNEGRQENSISSGAWVDSVTLHQPGDTGERRRGEKTVVVYNLQVAGHPSYSVNGFVVHNCQFMEDGYLTSVEHMDKGDFKGVFCGNPIGQNDPLDKMSEPETGWGTERESETTEIWRNKYGGITINMDGRNSPNCDEPKNRYPYLISTVDIERTEKRCGRDSMEFWTQVIGKRKPGLWSKRVLTRQICTAFGAFDQVLWAGSGKHTKVYAIDASYGGDRCVGGSGEFGYDIKGQLVLAFNTPTIIPVKVVDEIPEDQIVKFVMPDCDRQGIPSSSVFYDSTGRGALGTSFGRIWNNGPNPVEFGGHPTSRPVSMDMYIYDEDTHSRRLKRCDEHYSKFVTELWFSVRELVESRQARNFSNEVAQEFEMREWYLVKGDKREVETKEDTKKRMGKSPDLADWAAILVEGARRLGFQIRRMDSVDTPSSSENWKRLLRERAERLRQAHTLNYAA